MSANLKSLVARLNATCRTAMDGAAGLCVSQTNYDVELEHLYSKLAESDGSDTGKIWKHFKIDASRVSRDLTRAIDRFKTGNGRSPALSPRILKLLQEVWNLGSLEYGSNQIRSGLLMLALFTHEELSRIAGEMSPEFQKISPESLRKNFNKIVSGSTEDVSARAAAETDRGDSPGAIRRGASPNLDQYTIDLTAAAKAGKIDPVLGRYFEIRHIVDIVTRRRQNNPIQTGEAGVGKTAVVEGFAARVALGDVPPPLREVSVRTLDLGLLQAGAGVKGEFENRLKSVIAEVKGSPKPVILFIDEAHTIIGAGGQAGQGDAANLLKPALARGELRTIAATTWSEYKKYFEKDAALARRFQVVKVEEPSEWQAMGMMRGLVATLEKHHRVRILDDAVQASVGLSHRYISGRQLPDKSVSVLDTACARVAIGQTAIPPAIEDCTRRIDLIEMEVRVLQRESATGGDHAERLESLTAEKVEADARLIELQARAGEEGTLIRRIVELRDQIENIALATEPLASDRDIGQLRSELWQAKAELARLQGETPLMQPWVDSQTVAEVISGWTGIPVGKMMKDEIQTVLNLSGILEQRVIGQSHALDSIAQRIRTSRAGLDDPRVPSGCSSFRPERRGQDRNGSRFGRRSVWRRAQHRDHQHVRVSGGTHGVGTERLAAGLCGIRRGRRADRSGSTEAILRGVARPDGEGPLGRDGAVLSGVR